MPDFRATSTSSAIRHGNIAPTKWRKYQLLVQYGLQEMKDLLEGIKRYSREAQEVLMEDLAAQLAEDKVRHETAFYVVKLIPLIQESQLPNYRIRAARDLGGLPIFFNHHKDGRYAETWYCRTSVASDVISTAGRIVFLDNGCQIVEHVSRCSPRMIESFSPSRFDWPFIRASRAGWGRRFVLGDRDVYFPIGERRELILSEFHYTMIQLERMREPIETFCDFLDHYRFRAYSLEYKLVDSWFSIIDWDTPNDLAVLR